MIALALGTVALAAWLYLLLARGRFWLAWPRDGDPSASFARDAAPDVVAVVPARDEADTIASCIASLLGQDYPALRRIVLVDDECADATVSNARAAARDCNAPDRLVVVKAAPRPAGWTGKLWALECGVAQLRAAGMQPRYLLLTDADIVHRAGSVTALVARAQRGDLGLVSAMAMLRCMSLVERAFVPSFVFFFAMLYPFRWVNRPDRRTAAAAGGCILVDRELLEQSGGLAAVRGELIDDCALARRVKGYRPIRLDLTRRVVSVRAYPTLGSIRRMIARSAYAQLRFSPLLLAATVVAMVVTYVAPPLLAVAAAGLPRILGVLAWAAMALALQPMLRFYRVSPLWGLALPAIAAMYVLFTIDSAWQSARGRAGAWKGRVYPAPMDRG
jgi:hopene-associated glycosyltransferase HpnB